MEESCGKCTPCRIGNKRLLELLNKITEGKGTEKDLDTLATLGQVIKDTALCGLGQHFSRSDEEKCGGMKGVRFFVLRLQPA